MTYDSDSQVRTGRRLTLLNRYERNADLPLMVLSLAVIPLVAVEYLVDLAPRAEEGLEITYAVVWLAFVADYLIKLVLSDNKREYFRTEWLSLVLNVLTVPLAFNPLAIFRAARSLRLLRVFRLGAVAARGAHRIVQFPESKNSQLAVTAASFLMITMVSAVLVLAVEEGTRGSEIDTMGQSLWWAVSTVTTVGYGDIAPHTTAGRLFALVPMIAGVALIAVVASNFTERLYPSLTQQLRADAMPDDESRIDRRLDDLFARLESLEEAIRSSRSA
jgi:voltage-gated potassium channel